MSIQLTFQQPVIVTKRFPDGREEIIRYGWYESVMITKENGYDVHRTKTLNVCRCPVTEVECEDGSKLLFDKPVYYIEKSGYGLDVNKDS